MKAEDLTIDSDLMPVALVQLDAACCIQKLNTAAETVLGVSRHTGRGRKLSSILYHDCELFTLIKRAETTTGRIAASVDLDGPTIQAVRGVHAFAIRNAEGITALAMVLNPINADAADVDSASLGTFGSILGHEVKNPLAGISGAAQLLKRNAKDDQIELLDLILNESDRIVRLVNKLSAFELFSSPRCHPVNIHRVLDQVIKLEDVTFENIIFERSFDPSLPDVMAESDHLHEAFQNIIRNAAQAISRAGKGGCVDVQTRFSLGGHTTQSETGGPLRSVCVTISDDGPGIAAKDQKRIFDMFQTTSTTGSGLGLTIASQIIAAHGGHIELESNPNGTSFHVFIPFARSQ